MKNLCLLFLITGVIFAASEHDSKIRLAVLDFDDSITSPTETEKSAKIVTPKIERKFIKIERFYVREKNKIQDYIEKLTSVQLGLTNPESMKGESGQLKIDFLTVGTISKFDNRYEVDSRTVSIDNWKIIHAHGCTATDIKSAVKDIGWYLSEQFTREYAEQRIRENMTNPTISVSKFRDSNELAEKSGYSAAFAEILNSELGSFTLITTIERKYAKALLNEKIMEMAGVIENDNSENTFSIRGIEYLLKGDIRVFKDIICVNYKLYNSGKHKLIFMSTVDISSSQGIRPAAKKIANTIEDALNNAIGSLKVFSFPEDAEILINNDIRGISPATISLPTGMHELTVKLSGYETHSENIQIAAKKILMKKIKLKPISLTLLNKAYNLESQKKWEDAITAYSEFIEKFNDADVVNNALYRKGHIELLFLKKYNDATKTFQKLVNRYPEAMIRAEGYFGLAKTYMALGNKKKAREVLKYLIEKYNDTPAAMEARKLDI